MIIANRLFKNHSCSPPQTLYAFLNIHWPICRPHPYPLKKVNTGRKEKERQSMNKCNSTICAGWSARVLGQLWTQNKHGNLKDSLHIIDILCLFWRYYIENHLIDNAWTVKLKSSDQVEPPRSYLGRVIGGMDDSKWHRLIPKLRNSCIQRTLCFKSSGDCYTTKEVQS